MPLKSPHNPKEQRTNELFELLESLVPYIEEKIQLYALGGTALTILGIKPWNFLLWDSTNKNY